VIPARVTRRSARGRDHDHERSESVNRLTVDCRFSRSWPPRYGRQSIPMNLSPRLPVPSVIILIRNRQRVRTRAPAPRGSRPESFGSSSRSSFPLAAVRIVPHRPFQCNIKMPRPCPTAQALVRETALTAVRRCPGCFYRAWGWPPWTQPVLFQCSIMAGSAAGQGGCLPPRRWTATRR
jgi:hypothetical protein